MIDLAALRRAAQGDPSAKIAVKRAWLSEVLAELEELERVRAGGNPLMNRLNDVMETFFGKP